MPFQMLLCVDGSPYSEAASRLALELLARVDAGGLTVLHVVNVVAPSGNLLKDLPGHLGFEPAIVSAEVGEQHDALGRSMLNALKLDAQQRGLEITTVLEHGAVAERIAHWAGRFDVVLMGIRGETEARYPGQGGGSVHAVLSNVAAPVLLVPVGGTTLKSLAVAYDGSPASRHALAIVSPLVDALSLPVHAIYVAQDQEQAESSQVLDEVAAQLPSHVVLTREIIVSPSVHQGLADAATASSCSALALGFRGNHPIKDFVYGSASEYLVSKTNLIVLIAH